MRFINENYQPIDSAAIGFGDFHFEYSIPDTDFFLKKSFNFIKSETPVRWYTLDIGGFKVELPSSLYIMLADVYTNDVDWIRVEELIGRDLTTALYLNTLDASEWSVQPILVDGVSAEERNFMFPKTKNLIPVMVGDSRMVFVADKDYYIKTKKINFTCLY